MENLHDQRKIYDKNHLLETELESDPMVQFKKWYHDAVAESGIMEANAMSVSTIEEDDCPRTRMVLLKEYSESGFVFYTNYKSSKGKALDQHPKACLHFFWPALERQVIIRAQLKKVSESESDLYFSERPRGSQLGAWASEQSSVIPNREFLENKLSELEKEFEGKDVKRPDCWGGYLAEPFEVEFWQGRPSRLHDRILYKKSAGGNWKIERLSP